MNTLLVIDGNAIMHRAFHAIPATFKTADGVPTNAVYGFLGMIHKCIADFRPTHIIICFDTPKPTFRKELLVTYQAHRKAMADEFRIQIPLIKEMLHVAGITQLEKEGYEADDVIGTLVKAHNRDSKILILTGDKDIMQLVDENVYVISPVTGISAIKMYDEAEVEKKVGVVPSLIPDLKGLMGDASDNYPGAKGIGPKTANELLKKFGSIENLLANTDKIENERVRSIIETHREDILLSKNLATIRTDLSINVGLEGAVFTGFNPELREFLAKLQIKTLADRLFEVKPEKKPVEKKLKNDPAQDTLF